MATALKVFLWLLSQFSSVFVVYDARSLTLKVTSEFVGVIRAGEDGQKALLLIKPENVRSPEI